MESFKYRRLIILLILMLLLIGCTATQAKGIQAENGTLDLCQWDFEEDGNIKLDGEWELYWNQLLTYSDFKENSFSKPIIADIPMAWTAYQNGDNILPRKGFGTYRLHVKTKLPVGTLMSFKVNTISSAYTLFVNEKEVARNGKTANSAKEYIPEYRPLAAVFYVPDSEFDIIVHVTNYHFCKGGIWYSIFMGTEEGIDKLHSYLLGKELFVIGALAVIGLYYISVFLLNKNQKMYLYFTIICFLSILIVDLLGEVILHSIIPGIPFAFLIFLWYSSTQWLPFFLILYVGELFPVGFNRVAIWIYGVLTIIMTAIFIFTPISFYTSIGRVADYLMLLGGAYSIVLAAIGFKKKLQGAGLYILAVTILLICAAHDVFLLANIINTSFGEITYVGMFVLLFVHTLIHARRFAYDYNEKAKLLIEVQSSKEWAIANERKFLQAQIKPHFLYNTLSVIASLSTRDPEKTRKLIVSLAEYLRNSFDFDSSEELVSIFKELELVNAYVDIEKARFRERIEFELKCVNIPDIRIPRLSIQPLVENAIRHGILKKSEGGKITIEISKRLDIINIVVTDNGYGMEKKLIEELVEDSEEVKGIGVKNINRRLISLYGKGLYISSEIGKGSSFGFMVPYSNEASIVNKGVEIFDKINNR